MPIGIAQATQMAKQQLAEITGFTPVSVAAAVRDKDEWHITVDMLEMARLPESTDLLGTYIAKLDQEGNLIEFEKIRARLRSEPYEEVRD